MPVCKRDGFDSATSKNKDETFLDNEEVFYCEVTKEIFKEYEDYFRHVMAINSTVWQCEATGKDSLTYAEALKSEKRARRKMETFKDILRPAVMMVIENAKQSSLNVLNALTFRFLRRRFFLNEEVQVLQNSKYAPYKVIAIESPDGVSPANGVYEDTEKLMYKVRSHGKSRTEITVPFEKVRRQRFEFTSENLQMFIKHNVVRVDGLLRPKPDSYQAYVNDREVTFEKLFIGKMPHFTPSKIKKPEEAKKQSTLNKYFGKNDGASEKNVSAKSIANEKAKQEKAEAKAKSLKEEMERVRRKKEEQLQEQMRQRAEKRAKFAEKIEQECNALLTKTDDLERTDQRMLPLYKPVQTLLPTRLVGDALMLREFMHTYVGLLSGIEVFKNNISFFEMARSFAVREVAGPLSDILLILLGTIYDMQREEEEECSVYYISSTQPIAYNTHRYCKRHFSFKLNELPLDALTISEVLRLHFLSSGAILNSRISACEKWRVMYRNGYTSSEDPGLAFRMQHPHILRALKMYTIYQLPFADIMRVIKCLMAQILTYSGTINVIEERMENAFHARAELRALHATENQRLSKLTLQKRNLTNEFNQQCMEEEIKTNPEQKQLLEEKLNKKVAEIMAQSDRDHKKYEQQAAKLYENLFNFLVYLGMDRAYRKYYILESMPGIFVEHPVDCMDVCLENPPQNNPDSKHLWDKANLPKNRKDLRAYLTRFYIDEEKKSSANKNVKLPSVINNDATQEDKENQNHGQNGAVVANVLTNGQLALNGAGGGGEKMEVDSIETSAAPVTAAAAPPPTQYQLYMCTGDPKNCIVHDGRNADRQKWSYFYEKEDLELLIESLNTLGLRESELREQLVTLKQFIQEHIKKCPTDILTMEEKQLQKFKTVMLSETQRKYSNSNFGHPLDSPDLNEVMYTALVERILQFENEIYSGDLGRLKVKDMEKWRKSVHGNCYDPQCKLQWGPPSKHAIQNGEENGQENDEGSDKEAAAEDNEERSYAGKPYSDPGESLGDTLEIDSEDSSDEGISLHDSETLRGYVKQLSSALLQVEQAVERRFFKEPFGPPNTKDKDLLERKQLAALNNLWQWEVSLMESTSYSQVFIHLNVLYDCIMWARSTNKSNCMVCRRGSDPDKMLLCDNCNGGTHMFCMKPKMKIVPEGNWYCKRCVTTLGLENEQDKKNKKQKRKRKFIVDDDNSDASSVTSSDATNKPSRGRPSGGGGGGRKGNKVLQSNEIEVLLDDESEDDNDDTLAEEDEETENEDERTLDETYVDDKEADSDNENNEDEAEENEDKDSEAESEGADEDVCNVCSYDGSELSCTQCKESFHLECINLKRMPRYNFVCSKCKAKESSRKRKSKSNDSDSDEESSDDDEEDSQEPPVKRSRPGRPSRNSLPNGNATSKEQQETAATQKSTGRRSIRRNDNLPLNSPVLYELLEKIMKNENAWPFLRPVSQAEVPDYYKIIKNPMDFAKVKSKLNMGSYQINEEVMRDIELVFGNCDDYNVKDNEIYLAGTALEKYVIELCKELNLPFKPSDMNTEN